MARTVIDLDEVVFARAQQLSRLRNKVDVVNLALRKFVEQQEIEAILSLKGKIEWEGSIDEMRKDRDGCR